ncbi:MAG: thiamine pyrophosphate-dependent dehydrogenase E1 component subunit alpha [Chloroflexi bacterium]|nr:thiamine pyrophosphate-dependent dehydrogenase E1 component subunit alpha [Chloroflexota bacterium]
MARRSSTEAPGKAPAWTASPTVADVSPEDLLGMYASMVLTRVLDERWWALNRQGKAAIAVPSQGHEATHVAAVWAMRRVPSAAYFPNYRDLGVMVALGVSPRELLLSFMAKAGETFSGARQFPFHGARPDLKVFNLSSVVATQLPHAVGYALGCKLSGDPTVTLTLFGEGASSQGDFHEALNFASIHRLSVIFLCENNRYAISVPQSKQMAIESVADRAAGYGIPGVAVDGTDVLKTYQAVAEAVELATSGGGPTLIEAKVERLMPHTSDDDDKRYRSAQELQEAKKRDPLPKFAAYLKAQGLLTDQEEQRILIQARHEVDQATQEAEAAPYPDAATLGDHVYGS